MRAMWVLALCACAASALVRSAHAQEGKEAARLAAAFSASAREYVTRSTAARAESRQGHIFSPAVTLQFHKIIRTAFRGTDGRNMRLTILEGDPARPTVPRVNDVYPEDIPRITMPPTLLSRLPGLPKELAYRIIDRALVLQDLRTNVIVDVMPDAIPLVR